MPTPTATPSPTPQLAVIAGTGGVGIVVREAPGGRILHTLPEGAPVQILYRRQLVGEAEWLEIRDLFGRTGWTLGRYLDIQR